MAKGVRLTFEINETKNAELETWMKLGGLRTKKDLINNALTLLKWAVRQKRIGNRIVAVDAAGGEHRELVIPFLEDVAASDQELQ